MAQGINAAIVRAWRQVQREAALSGDASRVEAVRELVSAAPSGDFSSTVGDKFSPSPLLRSASGDIKSPWDAISTD
jgi:hypothetical protein